MVKRLYQKNCIVGLASFLPLTLAFVYMQVGWQIYKSSGSVWAGVFGPLWFVATSPIWIQAIEGEDKERLADSFLHVISVAAFLAALTGATIAVLTGRMANRRS